MRFALLAALIFASLALGSMLALEQATHTQYAAAVQAPSAEASVVAAIPYSNTTTKALVQESTPEDTTIIQQPENESIAASTAPSQPAQQERKPEFPLALLNDASRAALVNILCTTQGSGALSPLSGSGIIIDPRGYILTNAHVAQYLLLEESGRIAINCVIRTGAPAVATWKAEVHYLSPSWIEKHADEIRVTQPEGTGEYDFAILRITESLGGATLPTTFPSLPVDPTAGLLDVGDDVLVASYPAGFLGGLETSRSLHPVTTIATIRHRYTFGEAQTLDVVDLGGIIVAQSGSSGGAVVTHLGRLAGLIATSSLGEETRDRALHAITIEHINRTIAAETSASIQDYLTQPAYAASFATVTKPQMIETLIDALFDAE